MAKEIKIMHFVSLCILWIHTGWQRVLHVDSYEEKIPLLLPRTTQLCPFQT